MNSPKTIQQKNPSLEWVQGALFPAFYNITKPGVCNAQLRLFKKFSREPCLQAKTDMQRCHPQSRWWSLQARRRGDFLGVDFILRKSERDYPTLHKFGQLRNSGGSSLDHHQHFWVLINLKGHCFTWIGLVSEPPFPPIHKPRSHQVRYWHRQPACQKPSQRRGT